jgi:hypothetical protein
MSETAANHLADQVAQLNAARNLVLGDAAFYPQIVNGIIPIIGAHARLELRRWGAEFLAETFASPALATAQKEQLAGRVLQTIREILELPEGDTPVLKHIVQIAASLYPLAFRHMYVINSFRSSRWRSVEDHTLVDARSEEGIWSKICLVSVFTDVRTLSQNQSSGRQCFVGTYDGCQARYPAQMGLISLSSQSVLYQVCSAGCSGPDTWPHCRP